MQLQQTRLQADKASASCSKTPLARRVVVSAVAAPQGPARVCEVQTSAAATQQPTADASLGPFLAGAATQKELLQYDGPLSEVDPDIADIIKNEKRRQVGSCTAGSPACYLHPQMLCPESLNIH